MEKIKDARAKGYDCAYTHERAEIGIKSYVQNDNNHWIKIDIKTDKGEIYQFNFYDEFDPDGRGTVETSALVTKEGKDGKKTLLNTSEDENGSIITSVGAYDSDIITRGKKLLEKEEYKQLKLSELNKDEQLTLFDLFNIYVPHNLAKLRNELNTESFILQSYKSQRY